MKLSNATPKIKIWIDTSNGSIFGPGVYALLCQIKEQGSISEASKHLGISYRKAWALVKATEERMGITIIEKTRGGANGGNSVITNEGEIFIEKYKRFIAEVQDNALQTFNEIF